MKTRKDVSIWFFKLFSMVLNVIEKILVEKLAKAVSLIGKRNYLTFINKNSIKAPNDQWSNNIIWFISLYRIYLFFYVYY